MWFRLAAAAVGMVGALAAAPPTLDWPGSATVRTADAADVLGGNLSGLAVAGPDALWAVRDAPSALLRLERTNGTWAPASGWGKGRTVRFGDGKGSPDLEAVTTVAGDDAAVYVGAERDSDQPGVSRNAVLRIATGGTGALTTTNEWRLDEVLPASNGNTGIEGLAWVPDAALVASGLRDTTGRPYDPAAYVGHGGGLFVVGLEQNGGLYVVALGDEVALVASVASGLDALMEVSYSPERGELWALCDDACAGRAAVFRLGAGGAFTPAAYVRPPAALAPRNDEGFALGPACTDGTMRAVWSDDSADDDHALREATLPCTPVAAAASATPPTSTVPGSSTAAGSGATSLARTTVAPAATATTAAPLVTDAPATTAAATTTAPSATAADRGADGGGGSGAAVGGAVAVALVAGAAVVLRSRRRR